MTPNKEFKEFHINKDNFDQVIQHIPFAEGTEIVFDDEETYLRFNRLCEIRCEEKVSNINADEIFMKCFHNGYFATFKDCAVNFEIRIPNPNFSGGKGFKGSTKIYPPLLGTDNGKIDITNFILTFINEMKKDPTANLSAYITGWTRQIHFNKDLLSYPTPEFINELFGKKDSR